MINKRGQKPGLNRSRSFHQSFEMLLKLRPTDRPYAARQTLPLRPSTSERLDELSKCEVIGHNNI